MEAEEVYPVGPIKGMVPVGGDSSLSRLAVEAIEIKREPSPFLDRGEPGVQVLDEPLQEDEASRELSPELVGQVVYGVTQRFTSDRERVPRRSARCPDPPS